MENDALREVFNKAFPIIQAQSTKHTAVVFNFESRLLLSKKTISELEQLFGRKAWNVGIHLSK